MSPRRALTSVAPVAALVAVCGLLLAVYDVPGLHVLRYLAYLIVVIVLPGAAVWRWVMGRHDARNEGTAYPTWLEDLVCGAAIGYLIEIMAYAAARAAGAPALPDRADRSPGLWLRGTRPARVRLGASAWAYVALGGYVTFWLLRQTLDRLPVADRGVFVEADEMFHLSLVGELRHHFPAVYPFVDSENLNYQYFVHLHSAASSWVTGLDATELYRRFDPVVMSLLAALGAGCIAMRVTRRIWPGWVASALLVLVGSFDISGLRPGEAAVEERFLVGDVLVHSPTQTLAFVVAVPAILLALELVSVDRVVPLSTWGLFALVCAGMSGSKVTYLPMLAAGFLAVAGWGLLRRQAYWRRALAGFGLTAGALAASFVVLYDEGARGMEWDPFAIGELYGPIFGGAETTGTAALITATLLACWLIPSVGALGLLAKAETRVDPRVWLLVWSAAAGYGASAVFGHLGHSERYFERSAALLGAVLCAWGLSALLPAGRSTRPALLAAIGAGASLFAVRLAMESQATIKPDADGEFRVPAIPVVADIFFVFLGAVVLGIAVYLLRGRAVVPVLIAGVVGLGLARAMSFLVGNTEVGDTRASMEVPPDGLAAVDYLRTHSDPGDRVMTNAHCGPVSFEEEPCDARHFWMAALSERRFVLEGWGYAGALDWLGPFWGDPDLLRENDRGFEEPDELQGIAGRFGVSWAVVDKSLVSDAAAVLDAEGTELVFDGPGYSLLRVVSADE